MPSSQEADQVSQGPLGAEIKKFTLDKDCLSDSHYDPISNHFSAKISVLYT